MSRLDAMYRSILITKFFTKGWGKPDNLRRLFEFRKTVSNRDECFSLIDRDYPVTITKEENLGDCQLLEGHFMSPLEKFLPGIVPEIAQKAHFQALIPLKWADPAYRPMCLHLAGTGDHYFWRRRNLMAKPLLKDAGIGGIILENPFYGLRKPLDQVRSSLHNVSDIFVMGGCLILESLVLFHWCERNGLGPLGVTGLSMGGHMASLAATNWPKPLVLVPCLSWSTASAVFLQGVMSQSINWDLLEAQYLSDGDYHEKLSKMVTVVDQAFLAGKKFAQEVSHTISVAPQSTIDIKTVVYNPKVETITKSTSEFDKLRNIEMARNIEMVNKREIKNDVSDKVTDEKIIKEEIIKATASIIDTQMQENEDFEKFQTELKKVLDKKQIGESLYSKLISNKRFELEPLEVEELNKLIKEEILMKIAGKYQMYSFNNSTKKKDTATIDETHDKKIDNKSTDLVIDAKEIKNSSKDVTEAPEKKSRNFSEVTSEILMSLPFVKSKVSSRKIDISKIHWRDREALQFMRGVMDECTHLSNFSVPFDTSLIIAVCAQHDAYVPREDVGNLEEIWPGAEVRYVDAGHVSAYLLHQSMFRSCIVEAFERSKKKWKDGKHIA